MPGPPCEGGDHLFGHPSRDEIISGPPQPRPRAAQADVRRRSPAASHAADVDLLGIRMEGAAVAKVQPTGDYIPLTVIILISIATEGRKIKMPLRSVVSFATWTRGPVCIEARCIMEPVAIIFPADSGVHVTRGRVTQPIVTVGQSFLQG